MKPTKKQLMIILVPFLFAVVAVAFLIPFLVSSLQSSDLGGAAWARGFIGISVGLAICLSGIIYVVVVLINRKKE